MVKVQTVLVEPLITMELEEEEVVEEVMGKMQTLMVLMLKEED